ncbi:MAG: hypothetical protein AB7P14_19145 [Blastocatellales bacterium]
MQIESSFTQLFAYHPGLGSLCLKVSEIDYGINGRNGIDGTAIFRIRQTALLPVMNFEVMMPRVWQKRRTQVFTSNFPDPLSANLLTGLSN